MSTSTMTVDEAFESLTGFDEIAIRQAFGEEITTLADTKPLTFTRALVFVDLRRGNEQRARLSDSDAKKAALDMTVKAVMGHFAEEPVEAMPDEPVSAVGKDDAPHESEPTPSLSGAS